ncbi:hypothetical protein FHR24_000992 [Wenyingzhuangia heitensis]|uniref:DUF349 domain-containing protein n=1 Tax=Wenyingzhuangia heitensis TaxID=1487859 RepID=A0ABX0U8N3_9FLAO|nr:DUF349 domain-containing protein [Wenyingzhuangia heitensis]NIJ44553.1 hypothetical protein [Wenyingzhuangia heitensis]
MDKEIQSVDYKTMSLEALVERLKTILKEKPVQDIKEEANAIRASFYLQYNEQVEKAKQAFIEEGGNEIDFEYSQPIQVEFKSLWKTYIESKNAHHLKLAQNLKDNLVKREAVIEGVKLLIEKNDVSSSYKEFQQLQADWKEIGAVSSEKYQETWGNYHLYIEQFYDLLHLNNDLRSIDFKHNLEAKQQIIVKAKQLLEHDDIQFAFNELQVLHKIWKEDTGPVAKEFREAIWQEFSEITNAIHNKKTIHFEALRREEDENYVKKIDKIKELESFDFSKNKTFGDWKKSIDAFEVLKDEFLAIGKIPKNKTHQLWEAFKSSTKAFNTAKNDFFKESKKQHNEALAKKRALIDEAIQWKDSNDLVNATEAFKRIQAAWKRVGFVPRKQADALWNEFKAICDAYFDRLNTVKKEGTPEQQDNYNSKVKFLEVISAAEITTENINDIVKTWVQIGVVPPQKNNIDQDIQTLLLKSSSAFPEDLTEADFLKYKIKVAYWSALESKKLYDEQNNLKKEVDIVNKDLKQLENNLGFVSGGKKGNPLLDMVMQSIEKEKSKLKLAKKKLKYLRSIQ